MHEIFNMKGQDMSQYNRFPTSNFQECSMRCNNDQRCKSSDWRNNFCTMYSSDQTEFAPGSRMFQKHCFPQQQPQFGNQGPNNQGMFNNNNFGSPNQCQMSDALNLRADSNAFYTNMQGMNIQDCKMRCVSDQRCQSVEFKTNSCWFFSNKGIPTNGYQQLLGQFATKNCMGGQQSMFPNGQNQYGQQQFGQQCQMRDFMNMRGNDMFGYKNIQAFNFAACRSYCQNEQMCQSVEFRNQQCYFFKTDNGVMAQGFTLSKKMCSGGNQGMNRNPNGQQQFGQQCQMLDKMNMRGQQGMSYRNFLGQDPRDCKMRCQNEQQCQSVEYKAGNCYFFRSSMGDSSPSSMGFTLYTKFCGENQGMRNNGQQQQQPEC